MCRVKTLLLLFAIAAFTVDEQTFARPNPWTGNYKENNDKHDTAVKKISITEDGGSFKVRALITFPSDASPRKEVSMDARTNSYRNCNVKSYNDTLIAEFPAVKYKPLLVIKAGPMSKQR